MTKRNKTNRTDYVIIDEKELKNAIKDSGGNISLIARRLGVDWHKAKNDISKASAKIQSLYDGENERIVDIAENGLIKNLKKGNLTAQIFVLKTKGKHRGYTEYPMPIDATADLPVINFKIIKEISSSEPTK